MVDQIDVQAVVALVRCRSWCIFWSFVVVRVLYVQVDDLTVAFVSSRNNLENRMQWNVQIGTLFLAHADVVGVNRSVKGGFQYVYQKEKCREVQKRLVLPDDCIMGYDENWFSLPFKFENNRLKTLNHVNVALSHRISIP